MSLNKTEYILRSLQKITHKKWELFIISRILHKLDDEQIEFVAQQYVRRSDGTRALTDLYFPQFLVHLEIDEPAHRNQVDADKNRERDIIEQTNHKVIRIKISSEHTHKTERSLEDICEEVDRFVEKIRELKRHAIREKNFIAWNFDKRYSVDEVIKRNHVSIADNVVFKTQVQALRCFGFTGKGWQRGAWKIPDGTHDVVWFPRLYDHGMWNNQLTNGGKQILEVAKGKSGEESIARQREDDSKYPDRKHIVFAKARDSLGFNLLRYVGTFVMNTDDLDPRILRFDRIAESEPIRLSPYESNIDQTAQA